MAITNGYATLVEYKAWQTVSSTDATDDTVIEQIIEAASRYIDGETARTFYARSETRYFSVPNPASRQLDLDDDLIAVTTLTNGDDNTIAATEYNLIPKNVTPYRAIKLKASSTYYWDADSDGNNEYVISLAGTWGWAATAPHDIRQACLMIAISMYKRRFGENVSSTFKVTAAGIVVTPQDVPSQAAAIIRKYNRWL